MFGLLAKCLHDNRIEIASQAARQLSGRVARRVSNHLRGDYGSRAAIMRRFQSMRLTAALGFSGSSSANGALDFQGRIGADPIGAMTCQQLVKQDSEGE